MTWRVMLGTGIVALAPFLAQHTDYVLRQYNGFLHNTVTVAHVGVVSQGWSTPFTALRVAGLSVPEHIQTLIRIAAAFATLLLYLVVKRRYDANNRAVFLFSLAALYIILFSPRTETVTYALIAPAIAVFLARAYVVEKRRGESIRLAVIAIAITAYWGLQRLIAPPCGANLAATAHGNAVCSICGLPAHYGSRNAPSGHELIIRSEM